MPISRRHLLFTVAAALPWPAARAATALQLPTVYDDAIDPAPYLVSEKYDGVRGHWDGATLRFRSGREVPAPAWFSAALPRTPLDGELWLGRGRFDELSGTVRRRVPVDAEWRALRYMVFELPEREGTFAERAQRIVEIAAQQRGSPMVAVAQAPVADRAALQWRLADTIANGGEGLVLHLASAAYRPGRSDVTMKLKPERDAEAVVVGHRVGQGRLAGQLGALELRTPDGRTFLVGSGFSDAQRRAPPPLGSVVTYRCRELTSTGLPRFATFLRPHDAF
ncbi:MAG TPA: DNA ligase [Burkholderiaceae bacterium]|nr:DNA ligase [Burkholderiaceae bacterium]